MKDSSWGGKTAEWKEWGELSRQPGSMTETRKSGLGTGSAGCMGGGGTSLATRKPPVAATELAPNAVSVSGNPNPASPFCRPAAETCRFRFWVTVAMRCTSWR